MSALRVYDGPIVEAPATCGRILVRHRGGGKKHKFFDFSHGSRLSHVYVL